MCRRKIRTEACEEVIEGSERCGFPAELRGERAINSDRRAYGKDSNTKVVEFLPPVSPGDRRERFRVPQRVPDIVVGYMHISWVLVDPAILVFGNMLGLGHDRYETSNGMKEVRAL